MTGFDTCVLYTTLKLHFTPGSSYDFFKYSGKIKSITPQNFEVRKDRWFFHKLAKSYPDRDTATFFFAANFFGRNEVTWVRDLLGEEAKALYLEKLRIKESLDYTVNGDLGFILPHHEGSLEDRMKHLLKVEDGDPPELLRMALQRDIAVETLIVLNTAINFFPVWERKLCDTILFPAFKHKCLAYQKFLGIDVKKFRETLKERLTNT